MTVLRSTLQPDAAVVEAMNAKLAELDVEFADAETGETSAASESVAEGSRAEQIREMDEESLIRMVLGDGAGS